MKTWKKGTIFKILHVPRENKKPAHWDVIKHNSQNAKSLAKLLLSLERYEKKIELKRSHETLISASKKK